MTRNTRRSLAALLVAGPLVGACDVDPYARQGTWQPMGSNRANLEAMVAEPAHLRQGAAAAADMALVATPAIQRLQAGERQPLLPPGSSAPRGVTQ